MELPGIMTVDHEGRQSMPKFVGVETPFKVLAVLKGSQRVENIVLHLYREPVTLGANGMPAVSENGPSFVFFDLRSAPGRPETYLLFLVREADGRFAPAGGQVDPAAHEAVTKLTTL
jgi:hypothetical protein